MYRFIFKRFFDFLISLIGIAILFPVFIFIFFWLLIANDGKPFFLQRRPGFKNKIFRVIKFKTMNDKRDKDGKLLADKDRLTPFGKFLRSSSLDEIPQLINVFVGDMSLIGPRPLLEKYLPLYNERQARRHDVRPGITGWAQVNGRNAIGWEEKFEYDVWYVDHVSFALDLKILGLTFLKVIKRDGINQTNETTMKPFKGNEYCDEVSKN